MYVYQQFELGLFTVGFFAPTAHLDKMNPGWYSESDHDTREGAAQRVNYLNGGAGYPFSSIPFTRSTGTPDSPAAQVGFIVPPAVQGVNLGNPFTGPVLDDQGE